MLRDRGTKKWTSLMLPEHVALLKQMWREDNRREKPILDSQELEIINQQVLHSYEHHSRIKLTFFEDGQIRDVVGVIVNLHPNTREISMDTVDKIRMELPFSAILSISIH